MNRRLLKFVLLFSVFLSGAGAWALDKTESVEEGVRVLSYWGEGNDRFYLNFSVPKGSKVRVHEPEPAEICSFSLSKISRGKNPVDIYRLHVDTTVEADSGGCEAVIYSDSPGQDSREKKILIVRYGYSL